MAISLGLWLYIILTGRKWFDVKPLTCTNSLWQHTAILPEPNFAPNRYLLRLYSRSRLDKNLWLHDLFAISSTRLASYESEHLDSASLRSLMPGLDSVTIKVQQISHTQYPEMMDVLITKSVYRPSWLAEHWVTASWLGEWNIGFSRPIEVRIDINSSRLQQVHQNRFWSVQPWLSHLIDMWHCKSRTPMLVLAVQVILCISLSALSWIHTERDESRVI